MHKKKKVLIKVGLVLITCLCCTVGSSERKSYGDYKTDFVIDSGESQLSISDLKKSMEEYGSFIGGAGMSYQEFQEAMDTEWKEIVNRGKYRVNYIDISKKYDYDTNIRQYLTNLQRLDGVKLYSVGNSAQGRPIYMLTIDRTTVKNPKLVILTGNLHARETAGSMIIVKQLNDLLNDENNVEYLSRVKIVAIPCVNPDGRDGVAFDTKNYTYSNGQLWKANANGVDLNRNFPGLSWGQLKNGNSLMPYLSDSPTKLYFPGYTAGSEPETKAMMKVLYHYIVEEQADLLIDYHQQGRIIYAGKPWQTSAQRGRCEELAKELSRILAKGKSYKLEKETEQYGLRGEGSTLTDYACSLAAGAKFSTKYGFLVFTDGENEYPLITGRHAEKEANVKFATASIEIGYGTGYLGYTDNARKKMAQEYKTYNFDKMLYSVFDYLFEQEKTNVKIEDFKVLDQKEYPTGCESVATVAVLNYLGFDITKKTFIDHYLKRISTVNEFYKDSANKGKFVLDYYYVGDPSKITGKACNAPVIIEGLAKYFEEIEETNKKAVNLTGSSFYVLMDKLTEGKPIIIWLSIDLTTSNKTKMIEGVTYYISRHTVVLVGVDEYKGKAYLADSMSGKVKECSLERVKQIYIKYGRQAVVIE